MSEKGFTTIVTFVLDKSGSMDTVRRNIVSGFNEYIEKLKSDDTPTLLRLSTFNSNGTEVKYNFQEVDTILDLTHEDYIPDGLTPLFDSIGEGIAATEKFSSEQSSECRVIFTIMTDGYENSSKEYSRKQIFEMITQKEQEGWVFAYLGANQDSWKVGQGIGISRNYSANYDPSSPEVALRTLGNSSLRAKASMTTRSKVHSMFTTDERRKLREQRNRRNPSK